MRNRLHRGWIRRLTAYDDAHRIDERAWLDRLANARAVIGSVRPTAGTKQSEPFDAVLSCP